MSDARMHDLRSAPSAYEAWQVGPARVGDLVVQVASKPGVFAHGAIDPPASMLAEAVLALPAPAGARSLHFGSGNGLVPAVALAAGWSPTACDRYAGNVTATMRTLAATAATMESEAAARHSEQHTVRHTVLANPYVEAGTVELVTIRIPTDKLGVQQAVAEAFRALKVGGTCLLAGANDEGAKPAVRMLEQLFGAARLDAQHSGCRLVSAVKQTETPHDGDLFDSPWLVAERYHEFDVTVGGDVLTVATRPGVFSWEHLDEASALLADAMRIEHGESVLDLGCGSGVLGVLAARASVTGRVVLLDADADAVRCARRTAALAGCRNVYVYASDVASAVREGGEAVGAPFDVVVSNPPFHLGKGTELAIPRAFIEQAYAALRPGGRLYLVANRTLPYERLIEECFGEVRTAHDGRRFKVIGAVRRG